MKLRGIPVSLNSDGSLTGVEAVIDKDCAWCVLIKNVSADIFINLTDVDKVYINYISPDYKALDRMTVKEAERLFDVGHFLKGLMGPKDSTLHHVLAESIRTARDAGFSLFFLQLLALITFNVTGLYGVRQMPTVPKAKGDSLQHIRPVR